MKKITLLFLLSVSFSFGQVLSEDFEGLFDLPASWTNNDIAASGEVWALGTGPDVIGYNPGTESYYDYTLVGNYAVFDSDGYGGTGPAEDAALESPVFDASTLTGNIQLSFSHFFTAGYGGEGYVEVYDGTNWVQVAFYTGADQAESSFGLVELDVTAQLSGVTNAQVRFRWVGDYSWGWAVDNIVVGDGPSCFTPQDFVLGALGITETTAEIAWTDSNGAGTLFDIEWGPAGFTLGSGTVVNDIGDTSYNFTGLMPDTEYEFYITANCSGGLGDSDQAGPILFLTAFDCATYGVPYDENFDNNNAFLSCFTTEDVDGDTLSWISQQDLDLDGDMVNETFATNANGGAPTIKNDWLFSPALSLTGGTEYEVSSSYNVFNGTATGKLEALILDAPSSTANVIATLFSDVDFTTQGAFETLETMAYQQTNTFTPASSGDYYLAYRSFGDGGSGFVLLFNSSVQSTLGVDEFDSNNFSYSYNKNTDQLTLESSSLPFDSIEMFSILGQNVISRGLSTQNETIDLSGLTDGVYLATVSINGNSKTIKILKQ